jgi:hypothetical protein
VANGREAAEIISAVAAGIKLTAHLTADANARGVGATPMARTLVDGDPGPVLGNRSVGAAPRPINLRRFKRRGSNAPGAALSPCIK